VKRVDILDQTEDVQALVAECELTGKRTQLERQGQPVAVLISYDEYMALRETIEISNDADMRAAIERADAETAKNDLLLTEDLFDKRLVNDRLRISATAERDWNALADHERDSIRAALELLDEDPIAGAPLFEPLRGVWSHRVEHLRVIYRILPEARFIVILSIARAAEQP